MYVYIPIVAMGYKWDHPTSPEVFDHQGGSQWVLGDR